MDGLGLKRGWFWGVDDALTAAYRNPQRLPKGDAGGGYHRASLPRMYASKLGGWDGQGLLTAMAGAGLTGRQGR